jgi:ABC-type polar amino acid transport system ATPase subunit
MNQRTVPLPPTPGRETRQSLPVEVRVENLYKSFGSHRVLNGINLVVYSGEMIAIVGGSGNGKTTLLRQIIGLEHPDQGHVFLADHETEGSPLVELAKLNADGMERIQRHWAVVFQGNALLSGRTWKRISRCRCVKSRILTNQRFAARCAKPCVKSLWIPTRTLA